MNMNKITVNTVQTHEIPRRASCVLHAADCAIAGSKVCSTYVIRKIMPQPNRNRVYVSYLHSRSNKFAWNTIAPLRPIYTLLEPASGRWRAILIRVRSSSALAATYWWDNCGKLQTKLITVTRIAIILYEYRLRLSLRLRAVNVYECVVSKVIRVYAHWFVIL